jgi:DNA-binding beta-propeller fold protein YncE
VCVTSHGEGLSADQKTLYITCAATDEMVVVDVSNRAMPTVLAHVPVGPTPGPLGLPNYSPYALTVSPKDGSVWVSNNTSGDVRVYDPTSGKMDPARTFPVGGVAMFGAFSPDGATYYVPHQGDDHVTAIDTTTLAKRDLALGSDACLNAHVLVIEPSATQALVVCEGDHVKRPGSAVTINLSTFSVSGFVTLEMFPDGAAYLPPLP